MLRYSVAARMNAATAATADHVAALLWNPSSAKEIQVVEIWWAKTAATADAMKLVYTTTAGASPGSTTTPDIDSNWDGRGLAPISGALLYTAAFGTQPTVTAPAITQTNLPAAIGSGFIWVLNRPITVRAGQGLALANPTAAAIQIADVTFVWEE